MRLKEVIFVFCLGLAGAVVLGCMATDDHRMPMPTPETTTAVPKKCCPDVFDLRSTAMADFEPLLNTCPMSTQLICQSDSQPTIIYGNDDERVLAASDGDNTFSEVILDCSDGFWQLEDDTEDMPPIVKIRCDVLGENNA